MSADALLSRSLVEELEAASALLAEAALGQCFSAVARLVGSACKQLLDQAQELRDGRAELKALTNQTQELQDVRREVKALSNPRNRRGSFVGSASVPSAPVVLVGSEEGMLIPQLAAEAKAEIQLQNLRREEDFNQCRRPNASEAIDAALSLSTGSAGVPDETTGALKAIRQRRSNRSAAVRTPRAGASLSSTRIR